MIVAQGPRALTAQPRSTRTAVAMGLTRNYGQAPISKADSLMLEATALNDYGTPTFARASTAYDPYNRVTAISGARRRRLMPISRSVSVNADLIEGSRQNLCIQSSTFNSWATKTDITVTDAALTPADGTGTASRILEGSTGTAAALSAAMTITAARIVVACVRFKFKATNSWVMVTVASDALANGWRAWANISTGVVGSQAGIGTGAVVGTPVLYSLGNSEYMLVSAGTVAAAATACQIQVNSASADASTTRVNAADFYAWGAQVEMMAASATTGSPSSYIATTTVAVTRAADVLSVTYILGQTGTIMLLFVPYAWTGDQDGVTIYQIWRADDTGPSRNTRGAGAGLLTQQRPDAGGNEGLSQVVSPASGVLNHMATTWSASAVSGAINGVNTGIDDTTLTPPFNTNTKVFIGSNNGSASANGWVALLAWPRALSAGESLAFYNAYAVAT